MVLVVNQALSRIMPGYHQVAYRSFSRIDSSTNNPPYLVMAKTISLASFVVRQAS